MKKSKIVYLLMVCMVAVLILISWAPEDGKSKDKDKKSSGKVEKVVRIKDVEIKGEVKKPQAVFFLPRSKFTMDDMIVTESFVENIINVVDKE